MSNPTYATVTPANMELSPCQVTFNSVDLGGTLGNVTIIPKYSLSEIKADQYGSLVLNRKVSGLDIQVKTELAETKLKDNWSVIFPFGTMHTSGGNKAMQLDSQVGMDQLTYAHQLTLHPLAAASGDVTTDHTFFKACADAASQLVLGPTEQHKLPITWNVLPDTTQTPPRLYRFGDTTI